MANYNVHHYCGHTQEHKIYGTNVHGERARKIKWLEDRLCKDCYKAYKAAEVAEINSKWPDLTGSEKQIAWAMRIRAKFFTELIEEASEYEKIMEKERAICEKNIDLLKAKYGDEVYQKIEAALSERYGSSKRALADASQHITSAKWWIENFAYAYSIVRYVNRF